MWVNCIKTGEKLKWISCTEYGKLGASVRSSKCLSAGGRCVCQGDRTSVKKRAYCQDIHCKLCQLFGQANWLRAALFFGLDLTETGWCHSKIQVSSLWLLLGWPHQATFSLVSNSFFPKKKYHKLTEGLPQSLLDLGPPQAQQAGVVLDSVLGTGDTLPFTTWRGLFQVSLSSH